MVIRLTYPHRSECKHIKAQKRVHHLLTQSRSIKRRRRVKKWQHSRLTWLDRLMREEFDHMQTHLRLEDLEDDAYWVGTQLRLT